MTMLIPPASIETASNPQWLRAVRSYDRTTTCTSPDSLDRVDADLTCPDLGAPPTVDAPAAAFSTISLVTNSKKKMASILLSIYYGFFRLDDSRLDVTFDALSGPRIAFTLLVLYFAGRHSLWTWPLSGAICLLWTLISKRFRFISDVSPFIISAPCHHSDQLPSASTCPDLSLTVRRPIARFCLRVLLIVALLRNRRPTVALPVRASWPTEDIFRDSDVSISIDHFATRHEPSISFIDIDFCPAGSHLDLPDRGPAVSSDFRDNDLYDADASVAAGALVGPPSWTPLFWAPTLFFSEDVIHLGTKNANDSGTGPRLDA